MMNNIFAKTLYHGSRGGISGSIQPISRPRCDFGPGFYMGEYADQVKGLVVDSPDPYFYEMKIDDSDTFPPLVTKELNGKDWLYTVLAFRDRIPELCPLIQQYRRSLDGFDFVYGPIADDRMNEAIREFEEGHLTDEGLIHCLSKVDYGNQVVAKTQRACSAIKILSEQPIYTRDTDQIRVYSITKRREGADVIHETERAYRNTGLYIDQIIENLRSRERSREVER